MNTQQRIQELRNQLENLYSEMPQTFLEMQHRDKASFSITMELEKLENPISYQENINHWEGYELRF